MSEDKTLPEILKKAILAELLDVHVSCPGIVQKYDSQTKKADIQPARKKKYADGTEVSLPLITDVPVAWSSTKLGHIHFPLKQNDTGQLFFCDRSLDKWKVQGGVLSPEDPRHHHISDAVFYPGLSDFQNSFQVENPEALEIVYQKMKALLHDTGKLQLKNEANELIDLIVQFITNHIATLERMKQNKTNTMLGPQTITPADIVAVDNIKTSSEQIKTKIESFKV